MNYARFQLSLVPASATRHDDSSYSRNALAADDNAALDFFFLFLALLLVAYDKLGKFIYFLYRVLFLSIECDELINYE